MPDHAAREPILQIDNLSISFFTRLREIPAVMDFSCTVYPGEAMGLVGESGCGKSTVALAVMRDLGVNGRIVGGSIRFKGRDLTTMGDADLRKLRGSEIAMIYQEPMASLNPAMKIGRQLMEVPMIHQSMPAAEARALARQLIADDVRPRRKKLPKLDIGRAERRQRRCQPLVRIACVFGRGFPGKADFRKRHQHQQHARHFFPQFQREQRVMPPHHARCADKSCDGSSGSQHFKGASRNEARPRRP